MVWTNRIANKLPVLPIATTDFPPLPRPRLDCVAFRPLSLVAKGNRVRISKGVFRGFEGTVVARRGTNRLIIAVELLEPGVTIELDAKMVQALETYPGPGFRL